MGARRTRSRPRASTGPRSRGRGRPGPRAVGLLARDGGGLLALVERVAEGAEAQRAQRIRRSRAGDGPADGRAAEDGRATIQAPCAAGGRGRSARAGSGAR